MNRDLMQSQEIKENVRKSYAAITSTHGLVATKFYDEAELALVPPSARDLALGVANHLRYAEINEGDVILDIGCGGGIDTILAAHRTGPTGRVDALDFLPEMLERTAKAAAEAGLGNVRTVEGEMESIPLPDDSIDVVISNGVVNLAPRKARVFAECARVLRPGGQLCISDITIMQEDLSPEVLTHPAAWSGCVIGALAEEDLVEKLYKAGFEEVEVVERTPMQVDDFVIYPLFPPDLIEAMRESVANGSQGSLATSIIVRARLAGA